MPLSIIPRPDTIWNEPAPLPPDLDWASLHPHRLIASLLFRRDIATADAAREYLDRHTPESLDLSPLPNIDEGLERAADAIDNGEKIGIFGDYDADGITSATLLARAFRSVLPEDYVHPFVPDRSDGYGVSERGLRLLADQGCTLLIAVDTGTNDHAAIEHAQSLGMDVIILDHHHVGGETSANAITINPQLNPDGTYHELTGVGVAYLFAIGLMELGYNVAALDNDDPGAMLDLVAIGTVADVGALRGANRLLVHYGMDRLRRTDRPGVRALIRFAQITQAEVTAEDISFRIGPRLNAAGRVDSPEIGLRLMMSSNDAEADLIARQIEELNHRRRTVTDGILSDIALQILAMPDYATRPFFALYGREWQTGLVGPIASKITERMGVPAVVMQEKDGVLTGSGRSVHGVNLLHLFDSAAPLLTRYGGHAGAGGLTMDVANFEAFRDTVTEAASDPALGLPKPMEIDIHAWLPPAAQKPAIVDVLNELAPFGHGNPYPMFGVKDARILDVQTMGKGDRQHLKIITGTRGAPMEAIQWGAADRISELQDRQLVDLAGTLKVNSWNGNRRLQMEIKDLRNIR